MELPDGWRDTADPDATYPSGMCGKPTKCDECPSDFICRMKASLEWSAIKDKEHTDDQPKET